MISRLRLARPLALALILATTAPLARGDVVANFENLSYPNGSYDPGETFPRGPATGGGSYDNGWDLKGSFTSGGATFSNAYDSTYHSWSGWAYSNVTDATKTGPTPTTDDYIHQFAAVTGSGFGGSGNYAIANGNSDGSAGAFVNLAAGLSPASFEVTNTTYTYLSMVNGDGIAKKFGVGDYLKLETFGYSGLNGTGSIVGEVDTFLANYTSNASLPISAWTLVNLSPLAGAKSLGFAFASSDVGQFGINTPTYFAMDNLTLSPSAVPEPSSALLGLLAGGLTLLARRRTTRP